MYRPKDNFNVPMILLKPYTETIKGVTRKIYPHPGELTNDLFFGSFKTYGGTERDVNGVYTIMDTAKVETWYRPDITADCRIALQDGRIYEIIGAPENIEMRNQFLQFQVKRVGGIA